MKRVREHGALAGWVGRTGWSLLCCGGAFVQRPAVRPAPPALYDRVPGPMTLSSRTLVSPGYPGRFKKIDN